MQRQLIPAIILLVAAVIAGVWWLYSDPVAPLPPAPIDIEEANGGGVEMVPAVGDVDGGARNNNLREAVLVGNSELLSDPDIRKALCGFKGRVVNHLKAPVADCGVRIYRGAMDSLLTQTTDLFADQKDFEPEYIAGEVQTAEDGRFLMTGVWPRGFYLMFAGLGTDAPTHQVITKAPSPGEIVDLGDVVLNEAGVIVGEVYDSDGNAMAGALVRAADIPGALAAFFPAERFDPEGAVLIREPRAPVQVLKMPPWVKEAFEHLPIPTTRTDLEGKFRLVGVMPGSNMLATTARNFLSDVKGSVNVRAGEVKDVGRIRLREGEELYAKVLDEKGKPVAGAEVIAGSTLSLVPIDLASYLGETNAQGEIDGMGFSPGKVTIAARRSKNHAWVLAEPQSIISDVIVTLPAQYSITVSVQMADGAPVKDARFRLLPGKKGEGAAEMFMLGFSKPINLKNCMTKVEDGVWRVTGLNKGYYTMLAEVEGLASGVEGVHLEEADGQCTIKLDPPNLFSVLVVNQDDQPIRNAAIFAQARGDNVVEMPINCGRTDKEGRVKINKIKGTKLRVSADHPLWGVVHGETKPDEELVLRLVAPGSLHGVLSENGKPPLPGKFTVAVMWRRNGGARGPLENTPQLITAGLDGSFTVGSLQPGQYSVTALSSLDTLRSPGAIFGIAQSMSLNSSSMSNERVDVLSGQVAEVRLEVGKKPIEGPTAQLTGSVVVNGRVANGYTITARSSSRMIESGPGGGGPTRVGGRRFGGVVDERGRFDLGTIEAGDVTVSVSGNEDGIFMGRNNSIWSQTVKVTEGEQRDLTIDITTSVLAGNVYLPDGSPGARVFIQARGRLKVDGELGGSSRQSMVTKADGSFKFSQVPEGMWGLEFQSRDGDNRWRAKLENIAVGPGATSDSLRVEMVAQMLVKGRVDLAALPEKPRWGYLVFHRLKPGDAPTANGDSQNGISYRGNGEFVADDLTAGRWRVVLHTQGKDSKEYECGVLNVPPAGLVDVVLAPQIR
tara:strand:- start:23033 stop:26053 length:3021 start_codon:yes stop_codon:yes gene_type:complete